MVVVVVVLQVDKLWHTQPVLAKQRCRPAGERLKEHLVPCEHEVCKRVEVAVRDQDAAVCCTVLLFEITQAQHGLAVAHDCKHQRWPEVMLEVSLIEVQHGVLEGQL